MLARLSIVAGLVLGIAAAGLLLGGLLELAPETAAPSVILPSVEVATPAPSPVASASASATGSATASAASHAATDAVADVADGTSGVSPLERKPGAIAAAVDVTP
ncbi:MAG: hypothetical protein ACJ779_02500 [Chloroflexota bacterium]